MRSKWIGLMLLFGFLVVSCAADTGPRFVDLRANKQQQIQQELETNWPRYIIYYIPEHAVLFDLKDDGNTLVVSNRWIKFEDDKTTWVEILRKNTQTKDSIFDSLLQTATGFLEIIGPDEQFFGYLVHEKIDMVALKVIDRNTLRIYYSPPRTEGL
jgi:flagellar basal body-associated protein FliL